MSQLIEGLDDDHPRERRARALAVLTASALAAAVAPSTLTTQVQAAFAAVAPICRWQAKTALPESGVVAGHSVLFDRDIWAAGSRGREYPQPTDAVVSHRNRNTWKETLPPMGDMCLEAFTAE